MKTQLVTIISLTVCLIWQSTAATYHVRKSGADHNDGLSSDRAFLTVQRGVDALEAGDTLLIGPGEYHENVRSSGLGSEESETVIRAEIRGTAVLRGDVPAPAFEAVPGYRYVYGAPFDLPAQAVNELHTLRILETMPNISELEFTPGTCHYNAEEKILYISTPDMLPPQGRAFTVSVLPSHGLRLENATRVRIDGLAVGGFNHATALNYGQIYTAWGIQIFRGRQCVVENVTAFMNGGGIGLHSRDWGSNLIERCVAYGNFSRHAQVGGNIFGIAPNNDEIRNCIAYRSQSNGLRFHSGGRGRGVIRNSLSWGNGHSDIWIKCGDKRVPDDEFESSGQGFAEYNVAIGDCSVSNLRYSFFGGRNSYRRSGDPMGSDTILYRGSVKSQQNEIFADPLNHDFRLQENAPMRGSGPDGTDPGPYPWVGNIRYVSPEGDDQSGGLSLANAWRTIGFALSRLQPGDTLYIEPGVYEETLQAGFEASDESPVSIRGRGHDPVVIRGNVTISGGAWVELQRLHIKGQLNVDFSDGKSGDFKLEQIRLTAPDTCLMLKGDGKLVMNHSMCLGFSTSGIELRDAAKAIVSGTIFGNSDGAAMQMESPAALLYSAGNSLDDPESFVRTIGKTYSLNEIQELNLDFASIVQTAHWEENEGTLQLKNEHDFFGRGPLATSIGPYRPDAILPGCNYSDLQLFSAGDSTANLEWWTSEPAVVTLAWGATSDCTNTVVFDTNCYGNYSLTNLTADTTYYARIEKLEPVKILEARWPAIILDSAKPPFEFRTLASPVAPGEYYVAPDGDDDADGRTRQSAWNTVQHAANTVQPGATVWIAAGSYAENVRIRTTGTPEAPITFRSIPGERVTMDGGERALPSSFLVDCKSDLRFDGLYLINLNGSDVNSYHWYPWKSGAFRVLRSSRVSITRCFYDGRKSGTSPVVLSAWRSPALEFRNCVVMAGFSGMRTSTCPDLRIENCVFLRNLIVACQAAGGRGGRVTFRRNVIVDSLPVKQKVQLVSIGVTVPFYDSEGKLNQHLVDESENGFCIRLPDEERQVFHFGRNGRMSLADWQKIHPQSNSIIGDPQFAVYNKPDTKPVPENRFVGDHLVGLKLDFADLFATNPEFVKRGIGLEPETFSEILKGTE